jgi:hypothetical protein
MKMGFAECVELLSSTGKVIVKGNESTEKKHQKKKGFWKRFRRRKKNASTAGQLYERLILIHFGVISCFRCPLTIMRIEDEI